MGSWVAVMEFWDTERELTHNQLNIGNFGKGYVQRRHILVYSNPHQISSRGYTNFPAAMILPNLWCRSITTRAANFSGFRDGWLRTQELSVN